MGSDPAEKRRMQSCPFRIRVQFLHLSACVANGYFSQTYQLAFQNKTRQTEKTSQGRICFDTLVGVVEAEEAGWGGD